MWHCGECELVHSWSVRMNESINILQIVMCLVRCELVAHQTKIFKQHEGLFKIFKRLLQTEDLLSTSVKQLCQQQQAQ